MAFALIFNCQKSLSLRLDIRRFAFYFAVALLVSDFLQVSYKYG